VVDDMLQMHHFHEKLRKAKPLDKTIDAVRDAEDWNQALEYIFRILASSGSQTDISYSTCVTDVFV
jgi:hypothetical protein